MLELAPAGGGDPRQVDAAALIEHLAARGLKPKTARNYLTQLRAAEAWFVERGLDLSEASATQLAEFGMTRPATHSTRRQTRVALEHFYRTIGRHDPPTKAIRVPAKPRAHCRALSIEDAHRLAAAARSAGYRDGTAVLLAMFLGLRANEVAEAEWERFDAPLAWYRVTGKGDVTATIPVAPRLADELRLLEGARSGPIFPGHRGRRFITPQTVWNSVQRVAGAAGLDTPLPVHVLRHTAIATVHDNTGNLRCAMEFARHARAETTQIYTRTGLEQLQAAAASLDF